MISSSWASTPKFWTVTRSGPCETTPSEGTTAHSVRSTWSVLTADDALPEEGPASAASRRNSAAIAPYRRVTHPNLGSDRPRAPPARGGRARPPPHAPRHRAAPPPDPAPRTLLPARVA